MKSRLLVAAIALVAVGAGLWAIAGRGSEPVRLVRAWQLTPKGMYSGDMILDPTVSWSPDSGSLLLAATDSKSSKTWILGWDVGEKKLSRVALGVSPNYTSKSTFLFLYQNPLMLIEHNFATDGQRMLAKGFPEVDFGGDVTSFSYIPERKTIALRFSGFTRYPESAREEVSLTGKPIRKLPRHGGNGVLDISRSPDGSRSAEIRGELSGGERQLTIGSGQNEEADVIARGDIGAVAWSPDGRIVAFADFNDVKAVDPDDGKIVVVARFDSSSVVEQAPYVCRLVWSPDSKYLAAIQVVPHEMGGNMMVYVLDMSRIRF